MIQEINRAYDQPSTVAEYLIDRAAFGDHPLGRTVLGPEENLRSFTRDGILAFRDRRWGPGSGGAFLAGNLDHLPPDEELYEALSRFEALPEPDPYLPAGGFAPENPGRRARDQPVTPAHDLPARRGRRRRATAGRAGDLLDPAGGLDGLSAVRGDPREAWPVLLRVRGQPRLRRRSDPAARVGAGVGQVHRGLPPDAGDRRRTAQRRARPARRSCGPVPTPPGGWCWRSRTPAPSPATPPPRRSCSARAATPTRRSRRSTRSPSTKSRKSPSGIGEELAVACVGPHTVDEF